MPHPGRHHRAFEKLTGVVAMIVAVGVASARAQPASISAPVPFPLTLSNTTPLVFGMDADSTARALGTPLHYVSGRPGDEVLLTFRTHGGSGLLPRNDRLYLQFRGGWLTGWKADWGRSWMWR